MSSNSGAIMVGAGNNLEVQVYTPHYGGRVVGRVVGAICGRERLLTTTLVFPLSALITRLSRFIHSMACAALLKLDGGTVTSIALPWVFASGVVEGEGTIAVADQVVNPVTNGGRPPVAGGRGGEAVLS